MAVTFFVCFFPHVHLYATKQHQNLTQSIKLTPKCVLLEILRDKWLAGVP